MEEKPLGVSARPLPFPPPPLLGNRRVKLDTQLYLPDNFSFLTCHNSLIDNDIVSFVYVSVDYSDVIK